MLIENDRVSVTRWDFPKPGNYIGWHQHEHDYVVVPLFAGDLWIDSCTETVVSCMKTGVSYFQQAGVEHDVCNGNEGACSFIDVELLEASPMG